MNFPRLLLMLGLGLSLAGCTSNPQRESLERVVQRERIVLEKRFSVVALSPIGVRWEYVALPGTYESERKDPKGVYFIGPDRSIVEISELYGNELRLKVGGLYVPNDESRSPRLFYIFETDVHTTKSLDRYIQDRMVISQKPGLSNGEAGANIVGNAVGGAIVDSIIRSGVGQIVTVLEDPPPAISAKIRASRNTPKPSKAGKP